MNEIPVLTENKFAEIYNDKEKYQTLSDVAVALDISYQTVRNKASIIRSKLKAGKEAPELISRVVTFSSSKITESPVVHAKLRADQLKSEILSLTTETRYPITNPEVIVVEPFVSTRYNRTTGKRDEIEGTPRTWLSDTLKVEPVEESKNRKFIFTGAQNNAEVHEDFFKNLKAYAALIDADIVVGPGTYETAWWSENNPMVRSYDSKIQEYLCFGQMEIGDNFVFCGEMNMLPTASKPISDLTTYSRGKWAVFPHAKIQLKSVPSTNPNIQAHQVMTTGLVTKPKIIPRKAGIKSIFHHIIGATIVEFDNDGDLFCRQINADDDGSFYDVEYFVNKGKVSKHSGIKTIVVGDIHTRKLNPDNAKSVFGIDYKTGDTKSGSIVEILKPKNILLHDLFDNETRNHHHVHDNAYSYEMAYRGRDSVLSEVVDSANFLEKIKSTVSTITVIESNHDIGLEKYIREGRYRNDGINIRFGLQLEDAYLNWKEKVATALDNNEKPETFSLLEYSIKKSNKNLKSINWVHDGQSLLIDDIECGNHGFRGANGSRGTVSGYAQLGKRMTIADKHSPEICDGVYVSGCMNLHHGYNKGPSGWAIACVIQYPNSKRSIITLQNGKWRA
jgi:hypothetical protein